MVLFSMVLKWKVWSNFLWVNSYYPFFLGWMSWITSALEFHIGAKLSSFVSNHEKQDVCLPPSGVTLLAYWVRLEEYNIGLSWWIQLVRILQITRKQKFNISLGNYFNGQKHNFSTIVYNLGNHVLLLCSLELPNKNTYVSLMVHTQLYTTLCFGLIKCY